MLFSLASRARFIISSRLQSLLRRDVLRCARSRNSLRPSCSHNARPLRAAANGNAKASDAVIAATCEQTVQTSASSTVVSAAGPTDCISTAWPLLGEVLVRTSLMDAKATSSERARNWKHSHTSHTGMQTVYRM